MSEDLSATPSQEAIPKTAEIAQTAGSLLREARESVGLHIAALAVSMKVPVKKLEALESDRLDLLPDAVFVRALASSVCRTLKIDPTQILEKLPHSAIPRLNAEQRGINAPFRAPGDTTTWSIPSFLSKPVVLLVGVLLFAAIGIALYPDSKSSDTTQKLEQGAPHDQSSLEPNPALPTSGTAGGVAVEVMPSATVQPSLAASAAAPVAKDRTVAAADPAVGAAVPVSVMSQKSLSDQASAPLGLLTFKARGTSWVQVTDAKGVVLVNKTLAVGEVVSVPAVAPVSVVVGRADVTDVEVRGNPFSLTGIAKENVARFEVK
jgi:cytoskeleton protein RodZ